MRYHMITYYDQAQEAILEEHCRIYLDTPEEHDLHEKLTFLKDAYNKFHTLVYELGFLDKCKPYISDVIKMDHFLVKKENGQMEIKPEMVKSAAGWKALQERRQQQVDRRRQLLSTSK